MRVFFLLASLVFDICLAFTVGPILTTDLFISNQREHLKKCGIPPRRCHPHDSTVVSRSSTSLLGTLWDRIQIEEDVEPHWYLLNCIAGLELDLLNQCRVRCKDMPDAIKFVVPTERKTRSHGAKRMLTEEKVKYQGYVFAKLRLCSEVYEAIQQLDLCRSWMGTINRKGYQKLPPAPVALNELEVENFGLEDIEFEHDEEEESDVILDSEEDDEESESADDVDEDALKAFLGLKVEDMIKVTKKGKFFGEDGVVRRLKDGKIMVRFYTYGTMFEEWMEPEDVRKLTDEEALKGLSGPVQPITQRDLDGSDDQNEGSDQFSKRNRFSGLQSSPSGTGTRGARNRAREGAERSGQYNRSEEDERNWNLYKAQQRSGGVDDQWGRNSRNTNRRRDNSRQNKLNEKAIDGGDDWSSFVSPSPSTSNQSEEDAFFSSLMSDLNEDLSSSASSSSKESVGADAADDDDFFSSLVSELVADEESNESRDIKMDHKKKASSNTDDDFFAALEAELGNAFEDEETSTPAELKPEDDGDDFFAKLEAEMASSIPMNQVNSMSDVAEEDLSGSVTGPPPSSSSTVASTSENLSTLTVSALKEMLRDRGLKVSGKKSELIERLQQQ